MSFNQAVVIGDVSDDLTLRQRPSGEAELSFSVTTDESFRGESRKRLEWHRVVAVGKLAETCCQHLRKGGVVYVEGELRSHESEGADDKSGHHCTVIFASRVNQLTPEPERQIPQRRFIGLSSF